jgi:uncharacterized membrane protein
MKSLRRRKLRHLLLLALRITILLILVLAFSRPFFTSFNVDLGRVSSSKSAIILLDNSFSMRWGNRFDEGQQQAISVLNGLSNQDLVQIVSFSDSAQVLNPLQRPSESLKPLVTNLKPSDRKTNYSQALKLAHQLLATTSNSVKEIHLISDFQESGWSQDQAELLLDSKTRLIPHTLAVPPSANVWIQQIQIKEIHKNDGTTAMVSARVAGSGLQSPFHTTLELEINGKKIQEKTFSLDTDQYSTVEFAPFSEPSGVSKGIVRTHDSDSLPNDNSSCFCLNPDQKLKVLLLVANRNSTSHHYLFKALTASLDSPFEVDVQEIRSAGSDFSPYAAVLIHSPETMPPSLAVSLHDFITHGGGIVLDLGPHTPIKELNEQLGEVLPGDLKLAESGNSLQKTWYPRELSQDHPIFLSFQSVHRTYFLTTPIHGYVQVQPKPEARVLARLEGGSPLLVEGKTGKGRILLLTTSLSLAWNQFPLKSVFLPFCQQVIKYAADWEEIPHAYVVGDTIPLARLNAHLVRALERIAGMAASFRQSWNIVTPSAEKISLSDSDLVRSQAVTLDQAGFYQTRVHNFTQYVAANIDPAESDLRPMDPQRLLDSVKRILESPEAHSFQDPEASSIVKEQGQQIWRYLAGCVTILLLLETLISNRFYRLTAET